MKKHAAASAFSTYRTASGFGIVAANDNGLVAHQLPFGAATAGEAMERAAAMYPQAAGESQLTREAAGLLARYFAGERMMFDFPLDLRGFTPFRREVYRVVAAIPYGTVLSYLEVAAACGSPGGARAVGGAMANNPLPILIPCHRVVAANGAMTGFTAPGGVASKRELLLMEGVVLDRRGGVAGGDPRRLYTGFPPGLQAN